MSCSTIRLSFNVTSPVTNNPALAVNKPLVVIVLFVNVSIPSKVAIVLSPIGNVKMPIL